MPNTAEGFYYPDANTNIAPLETVLANMAASSDTVSKQTPRVFANYAAMIAAIPAPTAGRLTVTTQGSGILWQYDGTAAKWVVQNTPTFTNTAARDAAIPNPTAGIKCVIGSMEYLHDGTKWRLWMGDVSGLFSIAGGWSPAKLLVATVVGGVVDISFKLTRSSIWGPTGAVFAITDVINFTAEVKPAADTIVLGSAVCPEVSSGDEFGPLGTLGIYLKPAAIAIQWFSATAYIGVGGTLSGSASWRII